MRLSNRLDSIQTRETFTLNILNNPHLPPFPLSIPPLPVLSTQTQLPTSATTSPSAHHTPSETPSSSPPHPHTASRSSPSQNSPASRAPGGPRGATAPGARLGTGTGCSRPLRRPSRSGWWWRGRLRGRGRSPLLVVVV